MVEGVDVLRHAIFVTIDYEINAIMLHHPVAEGDGIAELLGRIDVEQRKRRLSGIEGLGAEMQKRCRVLADRMSRAGLLNCAAVSRMM